MKISTATTYSAGLQAAGPPRRGGVEESRLRGAGHAAQPETPAGPTPIQMSGAGRFDMLVYTGVPMKFEVVGNAAAAAVQDELSRDNAHEAAEARPAETTEAPPHDASETKAASKYDERSALGRSVEIEV